MSKELRENQFHALHVFIIFVKQRAWIKMRSYWSSFSKATGLSRQVQPCPFSLSSITLRCVHLLLRSLFPSSHTFTYIFSYIICVANVLTGFSLFFYCLQYCRLLFTLFSTFSYPNFESFQYSFIIFVHTMFRYAKYLFRSVHRKDSLVNVSITVILNWCASMTDQSRESKEISYQ